jgi:hypothetical protein
MTRKARLSSSDKGFIDAQHKFYPDAWMFGADEHVARKTRFFVLCDTPDEQRLAEYVKPAFIDAQIMLRGLA